MARSALINDNTDEWDITKEQPALKTIEVLGRLHQLNPNLTIYDYHEMRSNFECPYWVDHLDVPVPEQETYEYMRSR